VHGEHGLNERTVNAHQCAKFSVLGGQQIRGLVLKLLVDVSLLFKAATVDGFEKAALLDAIGGGAM
jgi:hypothetical protein